MHWWSENISTAHRMRWPASALRAGDFVRMTIYIKDSLFVAFFVAFCIIIKWYMQFITNAHILIYQLCIHTDTQTRQTNPTTFGHLYAIYYLAVRCGSLLHTIRSGKYIWKLFAFCHKISATKNAKSCRLIARSVGIEMSLVFILFRCNHKIIHWRLRNTNRNLN